MSAERAICRLLAGGQPVGLGFAVDREHVVTCAHVVNKAHQISVSAPRRGLEQADFPGSDVTLIAVFAIARDAQVARTGAGDAADTPASEVPGSSAERRLPEGELTAWPLEKGWLPLGSPSFTGADVAVLRLRERLPDYIPLVVPSQAVSGEAAQIYGPVPGRPDGGHVTVEVLGDVERGRVQVNSGGSGFRVRPGFSGGPVWRRGTSEVVGMLAACGIGDDAIDAYMLSTERITQAWPAWRVAASGDAAENAARTPSGSSRVTVNAEARSGGVNSLSGAPLGPVRLALLVRQILLAGKQTKYFHVASPDGQPSKLLRKAAEHHRLEPGEEIFAAWLENEMFFSLGATNCLIFTAIGIRITSEAFRLHIPYHRLPEFKCQRHSEVKRVNRHSRAGGPYSEIFYWLSIKGANHEWVSFKEAYGETSDVVFAHLNAIGLLVKGE